MVEKHFFSFIKTSILTILCGLLFAVSCLISFNSCHRHNYNTDVKLVFSTDTLMFDTVFTTLTSVTRSFTVFNPSKEPVKLDIFLAGGGQSFYSINVDGVSGREFHEVEIPGHDSIFVFVKVNIDPGNQNNPFLVTDSVLFYNTNRRQAVQLVSFGQDAHYILPDHHNISSMPYCIVAHEHEHTHWTNDKPWVIYGWAVVDSLGKLTIDPGTRIYVHSGGGIWVYRYGNIQVNGTTDEPVYFAGDRRESFFSDDYAQWGYIWINEGREDNIINNAVITNSATGIRLSSLLEYLNNKTIIQNTIIQNNKDFGVFAEAANLEMTNCQISNNGSASVVLQVGDYTLNHVTVGNYFAQKARTDPAFILHNYYTSGDITYVGNTNLTCNNSIIYGYLDNEFSASKRNGADLTYTLRNCLLKQEASTESHFVNCLFNKNPLFISSYNQNLELMENSPAIDAGMEGLGITTDLLGRMRNGKPDIGAYEYYPASGSKRK